ncbi:hypothetical protein SAMN05444679_10221 [Variovorax sp. CF079]|nr:hypothetical protein SAMN05444679_10221 [Variovorax sp. CF079]
MPHRRGAHGPTRQPSLAPTAPDATDRSAGLGRSCSVAQLEDTAAGVPLHRGHQPCSQCPDVGGLDLRVRSCRLLGGYLGHASLRALRSMRHIKPAAPPVRGTVQPPSRPACPGGPRRCQDRAPSLHSRNGKGSAALDFQGAGRSRPAGRTRPPAARSRSEARPLLRRSGADGIEQKDAWKRSGRFSQRLCSDCRESTSPASKTCTWSTWGSWRIPKAKSRPLPTSSTAWRFEPSASQPPSLVTTSSLRQT